MNYLENQDGQIRKQQHQILDLHLLQIQQMDQNSNIKEPAIKKLKSDKLLDEFVKQMKEDRQEREKKKEERQLIILQELKEQKEKQHKEKMDIMKTFCEAISGKKLFD